MRIMLEPPARIRELSINRPMGYPFFKKMRQR